jgi:nitroreductase
MDDLDLRRFTVVSRREFIGSAVAYAALSGVEITNTACAADNRYGLTVRALRDPLNESVEHGALLRELVRCATLAANSHNTQPWKFELSPGAISIRPDLSRCTPVVDPDEHHLWVSLGCATENLVLAAAALGKHSDVSFGPQEVHIALDNSAPVRSPLVNAVFQRQCTRAEFDGQPMPNNVLRELARAADRGGVRLLLLTERVKVEGVLDYVTQGNSAQIQNTAFVKELKSWVRFNEADALATGDGLFSRLTGNPTLPGWLGNLVFNMVLSEKSENDKYARKLRSSAGVAVFVGKRADRANWFEVGRAFENFALAATVLGVRTAFVNQAVEVPAVRTQFAQWLGLGSGRPDLVVRFGRGPQLPYSLRRPVADVIV